MHMESSQGEQVSGPTHPPIVANRPADLHQTISRRDNDRRYLLRSLQEKGGNGLASIDAACTAHQLHHPKEKG